MLRCTSKHDQLNSFNHLTDHVITLLCRYLTTPIKARAADASPIVNADIREHTIKALARSVKVNDTGWVYQFPMGFHNSYPFILGQARG
jgi:hypothetical protein